MINGTCDSYQQATITESLIERLEANKRRGTADFDGWVASLISTIPFTSVLDLCCGTGNQLAQYAQRAGLTHLCGVDISKEAIATARNRLSGLMPDGECVLDNVAMEDAFSRPSIQGCRFNLIACCYGLYYSRDPKRTLAQMIEHLANNGSILIIGPYGANNEALFELVERHLELPELPRWGSRTFLTEEVIPYLEKRMTVRTQTFLNRVIFPAADELIRYWRATTFFRPQYAGEVERDIRDHFAKKGVFTLEKHAIAVIATAQ